MATSDMPGAGPRRREGWRRFAPPWARILAGGVALFLLVEKTLSATGNPTYVPSVIVLGAFTVPVAFVAYVYDQPAGFDVPLPTLAVCALWGGVLGIVIAGVLEADTLRDLGVLPKLGIGLIEESAKLVVPLVLLFVVRRYRGPVDGILVGVAVGMGFAALETMGYGFVALLASRGDVGDVEELLLLRGLLSPAGHGAWTGLACAAIWRAAARPSGPTVRGALVTFVLVVVLHAAWDGFGTVPAYVVLATISLTLLHRELRRAVRARRRPLPPGQPGSS